MQETPITSDRLDSWKEIAAYLKRNERTVSRWEKRGLPVHRVPGAKKQAVFAFRHELDAWLISQDEKSLDLNVVRETQQEQTESEAQVTPSEITVSPDAKELPSQPAARMHFVSKWRFLVSAIVLVGIIGSVGIGLAFRHSPAAVPIVRNLIQITDDSRHKQHLRTDGATLYFDELEVNREILMSASIKQGLLHPIATPFSNVDLQDLSRDGQHLLVTSYEGTEEDRPLWIIPVQGGTPERVADVLCRVARWSPDNKVIACVSGAMVVVVDVNGTHRAMVAAFPAAPNQLIWNPDGKHLRVVVEDNTTRIASVWEIGIERDTKGAFPHPESLYFEQDCCSDWTWSQDGKKFIYTALNSDGKWRLAVRREDNKQNRGGTTREAELPIKIGNILNFAGAPNDLLYVLVQDAPRGELLRVDVKKKLFAAVFPSLSASYVAFSRDGQWMTYISTMDNSLWRSRTDGTEKLQLTQPPMDTQFAAWSPDGRQIAFMGKKLGRPWRIFLVGRDGGSPEEAIAGDDAQGAPTWSPGGKSLVYANILCQETQTCWIRRINLAARKEELLSGSHGLRTARWSPDGKYIAALRAETHQLMLLDIEKQHWTVLAESITGDDLQWSDDSASIYADSPRGERPVIEKIRIRDGHRSIIADLSSFHDVSGQMDAWFGLMPDDSIIMFHRFTAGEVYSLEWTDH